MQTFEIDIAGEIYDRGMRLAAASGVTFSEVCSLAILGLLKCSNIELEEMAAEMRDDSTDD